MPGLFAWYNPDIQHLSLCIRLKFRLLRNASGSRCAIRVDLWGGSQGWVF